MFNGCKGVDYKLDEKVGAPEWCERLVHDFDFPNQKISEASIYKNKNTYLLMVIQDDDNRVLGYEDGKVYLIPKNAIKIDNQLLHFSGLEFKLDRQGKSYPSIHGDRGKLGKRLFKE